MSRALLALAAAVAVAGCKPAAADDRAAVAPISWTTLADGSRFAIEPAAPGALARSAVRCWAKAGGFDCLEAGWIDQIGFSGQRFAARALPARWPVATPKAGYSCGYAPQHMMFQEEIRSANARLLSNETIPLGGEPWSRAKAEGFLRANGVGGSPYFACAPVMALLHKGSLETLGTTAIGGEAIR